MNIKRSIWTVPVTAVILFGLVLALMVYFNLSAITAGTKYPLVTRISAIIQDVDTLGDGFVGAAGEGRSSLEALAAQAQQVNADLRALGALPEQAALAERLTHDFEAWYRPAMQARLMHAPEGAPGALPEVIERHYSVLQANLEEARLLALRSFAESALDNNSRAKRMLGLTVAVSVLLITALGLMVWVVLRADEREASPTTATSDGAASAEDQQRALTLLKSMQGHLDTVMAEVRVLAPAIRKAGGLTPRVSNAGPRDGSAGRTGQLR